MALILAFLILALLALNAWMMAPTRLQWQLQLVTTEFGHWLALLSLVLIYPAMQSSRWSAPLFLLLACVLLVPAFQASRIAKEQGLPFSWFRLWLPLHRARFEVQTERRTFWKDGDESLDIVIYRPVGANKPLPCLLIAHTGG